jgi:hypothetical protein
MASKMPMGQVLKEDGPLRRKVLYLAGKKRIMMPAGAALAAGGYLAMRKKDK